MRRIILDFGLSFYFKNGWEKIKENIAVHYEVDFEESLMNKKQQKNNFASFLLAFV